MLLLAIVSTQVSGAILFERFQSAMAQVESLSGTASVSGGFEDAEFRFTLKTGAALRVDFGPARYLLLSRAGATHVNSDLRRFRQEKEPWTEGLTAFQGLMPNSDLPYRATGAARRTKNGWDVELAPLEPLDICTYTLSLDGQSWLPTGWKRTRKLTGRSVTETYGDLRINQPIDEATFEALIPADFSPEPPDQSSLPRPGEMAPDVTMTRLDGSKVKVSEALKGKRALILNFWFIGCSGCHEEYPYLQAMYKRLREQGLEVLSVNREDSPADIEAYMKRFGFSLPTVISGAADDGAFKRYGVLACPTSFLIGSDGRIMKAFFLGGRIRSDLRSLGFDL